MDDKTKKLIEERVKLLPPEIQAVVLEGSWLGALEDIRKKHELRVDQAGELQTETFLVLLGLTKPADYVHEIQARLNLVGNKAGEIAEDAEKLIFRPLITKLEEVYSRNEETAIAPEETQVLNNTGIEIETEAPLAGSALPPSAVNRETLLEEVENPLLIPNPENKNIIASKLTQTFTIPKKDTDQSLGGAPVSPPLKKSGDPYRESVE
jgi:hypothetical protein